MRKKKWNWWNAENSQLEASQGAASPNRFRRTDAVCPNADDSASIPFRQRHHSLNKVDLPVICVNKYQFTINTSLHIGKVRISYVTPAFGQLDLGEN